MEGNFASNCLDQTLDQSHQRSHDSLNSCLLDSSHRRSSNRSIKRKKFDDELIEYKNQVLQGVKAPKHRSHFSDEVHTTVTPIVTSTVNSDTTATITPVTAIKNLSTVVMDSKRSKHISRAITSQFAGNLNASNIRRKKARQPNHLASKDLGRWKPTDDLALIIGVQQTNDLRTVHLGTKFSCKFTVQELQQRWYALLYDKAISRVSASAIRNLHPEIISAVQDKALWRQNEEQILSTIKSNANPTLEDFANLLVQHPDVFYSNRTSNSLFRHWQTLKLYHLLPDQVVGPLPSNSGNAANGRSTQIMSFNDAEDLIQDTELLEPCDEQLDRELKLQQRKHIKQIRHLENELGRWNVLVDSVSSTLFGNGNRCGNNNSTFLPSGEMDNQTLAVLRGRMVRYLMRSKEIIIGRTGRGFNVDVDLALEGPAHKISRRQGTLKLRNTGEFYLTAEGKRPIFVDGRPILAGTKVRLHDNTVIEMASLRFIFNINQDVIRSIHDSMRYTNLNV